MYQLIVFPKIIIFFLLKKLTLSHKNGVYTF